MKDGEPEAKKPKVQEEPCETANGNQKPTVDPAQLQRIQKIAKQCEQRLLSNGNETNGETEKAKSDIPQNTNSKEPEKDSRGPLSSGRKLENIIGRLNSDKVTHHPATGSIENSDDDDEALICKADASTQTSLNFMKAIKGFVLERMNCLERSILNGAVTENVLNALQKENQELKEKAQKLQEKLNLLMQDNSKDERSTQPLSNLESEGSSISSITKQSAVVSPYNVHATMSSTTSQGLIRVDERTAQQSGIESRSPQVINPAPQHEPVVQVNVQQQSAPGRPQVKYVAPRIQQHPPPGAGPPYAVQPPRMQNVSIQRAPQPHSGARPPVAGNQIVYVNQPVRVTTAPRMSTLPPQPPQMQQYIAGQPRQMLQSPTGTHAPPNTQVVQYVQRPSGVPQGAPRVPMQYPGVPQEQRMQVPPNITAGPRIIQIPEQRPAQPPQPPPYHSPTRVPIESIPLPNRLQVNINVTGNGIVLSWDLESSSAPSAVSIECYHLFASQDTPTPPTTMSAWKKIGVVKALPLPMACTLTQFVSGNSYHFAVLAVDIYGREGPLSNPCTVRLNK